MTKIHRALFNKYITKHVVFSFSILRKSQFSRDVIGYKKEQPGNMEENGFQRKRRECQCLMWSKCKRKKLAHPLGTLAKSVSKEREIMEHEMFVKISFRVYN